MKTKNIKPSQLFECPKCGCNSHKFLFGETEVILIIDETLPEDTVEFRYGKKLIGKIKNLR